MSEVGIRRALLRAIYGVLALLTGVSCDHVPTNPERNIPATPARDILDAVHGGGNAHFYFLPPMVPSTSYSGTFDASVSPIVDICVVRNGACATPLVASYTMSSGVGSQTVRVDPSGQHYMVNWNTGAFTLDLSATYRVRVRIVNTEIGHCDVRLVSNGSAAKNATTGQDIVLVDGRTLPIKFRIEKGAVAVIGAAGGMARLNDGAVQLQFPAGAVPGEAGVTATPIAAVAGAATDAAIISGTQYEFQPSPTSFAAPVTLTLSYPLFLPAGVKASRLAICKMVGDACLPLQGGAVNPTTHTVSAPITSFSSYGITTFPEMAYSVETFGQPNTWWLHTANGELQLNVAAVETALRWSPDGMTMMYASPYDAGPGYGAELRAANADGTNDHHVAGVVGTASTQNAWVPGSVQCPRWSPDGTAILFNDNTYATNSPATVRPDGTGLSILAAPGRPLDGWDTNGCAMWWGGNNHTIAFRAIDPSGASSISLIEADGTGLRKLVDASHYGEFAASADGSQYAIYADWVGNLVGSGVYVMNADGSNLHLLMARVRGTGLGYEPEFQWSPVPGDNRLLFTSCDDGYGDYGFGCSIYDPGAWIINANGSNAHRVLGSVERDWAPYFLQWSPDARRIAVTWYTRSAPIQLDPSFGFTLTTYIVNTDGTGLQLLLGPMREGRNATWRP